jgi:hypothetical protein
MCLASTGDGELHSLRADVRKAKMILTGNQIKQAVRDGDIMISSFSDDFVESNSYGSAARLQRGSRRVSRSKIRTAILRARTP